ITTTCEVNSITVQVTNGTIASASWNCGALPAGYVGQSSFTFPASNCILDMNVCINATAPGVGITYIINFTNGQVCDKTFQMDCVATNCCDSVRIEKVQGADCCARIVSKCEVKAIQVTVHNGTIGAVSWNCGTLPAGYAGQTAFMFPVNNCALDMTVCVDATQTGVSIDYLIYFLNGPECLKSFKMDCKVKEDCCALLDFKLKSKWPLWKTLVGTFNITNLDPTSPICSVDILPTPAGTFTTGTLIVDGVTSGQSWTYLRIPTTGNLFPAAVNSIKFNLVSSSYSGIIKICVVKCDGTKCCFDVKWNTKPLDGTDISLNEIKISDKLIAISISPILKTPLPDSIKYLSFGLNDDSEISPDGPHFFAISATNQAGDEFPEGLAVCDNTYMGSYNAFFELSKAISSEDPLGAFHLVFTNKVPKLGCTLFDKDGNVLFTGSIAVNESSDVTTAVVIEGGAGMRAGMFEFLTAYPNPSNGQFTLSYAIGSKRDVEIQVIDTNGKILYSTVKDSGLPGIHNISMDASSLPKGNYFVRLISDGQVLAKPVVLQ
ncbi:MAG: T9SS type A sorting domain-containing protein, partial [Bacteroidia bacterium]|nr:T9SS type A sorting domain-containing protein [Bacteroidia bacterium]